MKNYRRSLFRRFVSALIRRRPGWLNAVLKEAIFRQGYIPDIIRNRKYFLDWEKRGFHISENHFYQPIPELGSLDDSYWKKKSKLKGLDLNLEGQLKFLDEISKNYGKEFNTFPLYQDETSFAWEYFVENQNFTSVDGEVLYSVIRKFKPSKIIEVGSGYTTFVISRAIEDEKKGNAGYKVSYNSIEPYPRDFLKTKIPSLDSLITKQVQEVPLDIFEGLEENDVLFIDGSHMLKFGSDVEYVFLEILPVLKKGVVIHFHDIFLPLPYPKSWTFDYGWFWNEQYLLQAFLMFNPSFEIIWSGSMMFNFYPDHLEKVFRSFNKVNTNPGSIWIRKIV